ncbi:MAG TPA: short-chain dehydrogenase/reductase [Solirubrobacteraceae bacterium]|jgi:NAD(P)-dependent dehydrogenase (short-subunit alcohol dehydrogenase family)|nr:short-chain dehydrogenase/reductase [Solirubrobacteraceae bacterium]
MARPIYDVRDRTVLITGAARGIGAETARRLAARGANLALVGLEPELLERLAGELGDRAAFWEADVRDAAAVHRAVDGAVERFGGIDVMMANAGIAPPASTVAAVDPEAFERVIDINLLGVWRTVRATLPHVRARRGYLLCIASMAAAIHGPLMAPYSMAKAGVEALADSLRPELAGDGVDVGCAYFGFIDTDMTRDAFVERPTERLRARAPSSLTRTLPVAAAARGLERGIERRARRIVVPRSAIPLLFGGRLFQSAFDAGARRAGIEDIVRDVES